MLQRQEDQRTAASSHHTAQKYSEPEMLHRSTYVWEQIQRTIVAQGRTDTAQLTTASSRAVTCTFRYGDRKLTFYNLKCRCKQQLVVYLQKHQAICEFSQFVFHCAVITEAVPPPEVCQAQIIWSSTCTTGLAMSCTHRCNVQGSINQSQAQFRFSSSSAT